MPELPVTEIDGYRRGIRRYPITNGVGRVEIVPPWIAEKGDARASIALLACGGYPPAPNSRRRKCRSSSPGRTFGPCPGRPRPFPTFRKSPRSGPLFLSCDVGVL